MKLKRRIGMQWKTEPMFCAMFFEERKSVIDHATTLFFLKKTNVNLGKKPLYREWRCFLP